MQELYTQYVSFASPDRKTLYEQALKTIEKEAGRKKSGDGANPQKTLIDFLNKRDGTGIKLDKAYQMSGGGTVTAHDVTGGGFILNVGCDGNTVMSINVGQIHGNGVYYTPTSAEQALKKEISNIFYNTVNYAKSFPSSSSNVRNTTNNEIDITI